MLLAAVFAVLSVGLGLLLGLGGRPGSLGAVRAFAIGASLATVFGGLLPEALVSRSGWVFGLFVSCLALPSLVERAVGGHDRGSRLALEVSFVGLALHQLADGLAAGALLGHGRHERFDFLIALAGHTVPVVAAIVIAFATVSGPRVATTRAAGLAAAAVVGIGLAGSAALAEIVEAKMPLVAAAAGGLLLHVVLHGAADDPPSKLSQRVLELASLVAGLVLIPALGGGHDHDHPGHVEHGPETGFFVDLLALTEQAAPLLAVGLLVVLALPAKGAEQRLLRFDFVALRSLPWSALGVVTAAALETVLGLGPLAGLGRGWVAVWIALSVAVPTLQGLPDARSLRTSAAMLGLTLAIVATGFALAVTSTEQLGGAVALAALALVVLRIALLSGVREIFAHLHPTSHGEHHG